MQGRAGNAVAGRDEGQSVSSTRLPAISTTAVTMHPVPMDGTDGKVANERAQVGASVVEATGTATRDRSVSVKIAMYVYGASRPIWHRARLNVAHRTSDKKTPS